jgi:predicted Fe-Mo cluster-binding NifX family protein
MSYKIALTSSDCLAVDLHFGHARQFAILLVHEHSGRWELLERRDLRNLPSEEPPAEDFCGGCGSGQGRQDGRLQSVIATLSDCAYVLTAKIGAKPQAALKLAGITALESPADLSRAIPRLNAYHKRFSKTRVAPG